MIVRQQDVVEVLLKLAGYSHLALDTETTGLRPYHGDRLFSLVIATDKDAFYFNFQGYPGLDSDFQLLRQELRAPHFRALFGDSARTWYLHNSKFDLAILAQDGVALSGHIHDTLAIARVEYNEHMRYGLDECAKRIGLEKSNAVEEYIQKNKLYILETVPGQTKRFKRKFFDRVPLEIMVPYACQDARVTYQLARHQHEALGKIAASVPTGAPSILSVASNEKSLTKVCFEMEQEGIKVDKAYCTEALDYEQKRYQEAARVFEGLTGIAFVDSNKTLATAFSRLGEAYGTTAKGNPSFTDAVLSKLNSPLAKIVQTYRGAYKTANTYYSNLLYHADERGIIHPNMRQAGTTTGRFSYADPNLQNIPKDEEGEKNSYPVRRAFIPKRSENILLSLDYDQMELRMMLEYAGQMDLIAKINEGMDPHQSTADLVGCTRREAKVVTFGLIYGMGVDLLGLTLGISRNDAIDLRAQYFDALPNVQRFIRQVMRVAEGRGYVFNWYGRRYYFPDATYAYIAPNYVIQGGCAEVVKIAMNRVAGFLSSQRDIQTRMILQVHDELVFEMPRTEYHLIPEIKNIMETVYPYKHIRLTCGVDYSDKNWADKTEGIPCQ